MRSGSVPSRWLSLANRWDPGFLLEVRDKIIAKGIEPDKASDDEVRAAIREVTGEVPA